MVTVSFLSIGRALRPAHGEIRNAERGNVGEIVDGIVKQRDAAAENAAKHFRDDQTKREYHGPAKNGRLQCRMSVAGMSVRMTGVVVVVSTIAFMPMVGAMAVGVPRHGSILRAQGAPAQPPDWLITQFDTALSGM